MASETEATEPPKETATPASGQDVPVTERAVPTEPAKETSQYIVTVDNKTGMPTKIEKLNEATGERKELLPNEYDALIAYYGYADPSSAMYSAAVDPVAQAYQKGYIDYLKSLTSRK